MRHQKEKQCSVVGAVYSLNSLLLFLWPLLLTCSLLKGCQLQRLSYLLNHQDRSKSCHFFLQTGYFSSLTLCTWNYGKSNCKYSQPLTSLSELEMLTSAGTDVPLPHGQRVGPTHARHHRRHGRPGRRRHSLWLCFWLRPHRALLHTGRTHSKVFKSNVLPCKDFLSSFVQFGTWQAYSHTSKY